MSLVSVSNYLVPSTGTTNGFPVRKAFSATPTVVDFREVELNGVKFVPSGVFIDNGAGAGDLTITIEGMSGYTIVCPPGIRMQTQYPAPMDQIVQITGNGTATVIFVDFPVIPFQVQGGSGGTAVTIADGADAALGATTDAVAASASANATLIAMTKLIALFNTQIDDAIGAQADAIAASPVAVASLIALTKLVAQMATDIDTAQGAQADAIAASPTAAASLIALTKLNTQLADDLVTATVGQNTLNVDLPLNFGTLPQTLTYAAGILQTIAVTNGVNTWTQTYTYTGADLTGISGWVQS